MFEKLSTVHIYLSRLQDSTEDVAQMPTQIAAQGPPPTT